MYAAVVSRPRERTTRCRLSVKELCTPGQRTAGAALAAVGLLAGAGTATAGTSGQQVSVSTRWSDQIRICGRNHVGDAACTGWIATPNAWTSLPGWWWQGELTIQGYQQETQEYRVGYCDVPPSQPSDWTQCNLYGTL